MSSQPSHAARMQQWEQWLGQHHEAALQPDLAVVDAHHHLWDRSGHTYLPEQLLQDARGHQVVATVFVECQTGYRDSGPEHLRCVGETDTVMGLLSNRQQAPATDVCAGIVGRADLALGDGVDEVLDGHIRAGGERFKGIRYATAWDADPRVHASYPTHAGMLLQPAVQAGARRLAGRHMSLDLWLYFHQLQDVAALAQACPGLVLVVNHCGGPMGIGPYADRRDAVAAQWRMALASLRPFENVVLKFGGMAMALAGFGWRNRAVPPSSSDLVQAWQPYFDTCLETFGPARCMFESNFPVDRTGCSYTVLWNAFKLLAAPLSVGERDALLANTARKTYRLG